jgi:thiamine-phosphate pyrophosphorylase
LITLAKAVKEINGYKATLIINDNVYLAQQIAADGVHLGLTDMGIPGEKNSRTYKIIGATANTFEVQLMYIIQRITLALVRFSLPPLRS